VIPPLFPSPWQRGGAYYYLLATLLARALTPLPVMASPKPVPIAANPRPAPASVEASPWSGRAQVVVGSMLTKDQIGRMRYDSVGFVGGLALSRRLIPLLSAQWWVRGGGFLADTGEGGVLGTTLGLRLHSREREVMPYLSVDGGAVLTGKVVRPSYSIAAGVDWRVRGWMTLGPVVGFDHVIQWNGPTYSTDALYFWIGLGVNYDRSAPLPPPKPKPLPFVLPPAEIVVLREPAPPPSDPGEIERLMERTIAPSVSRVELLAPVLFAFDSDQIEPIGVAMLHEVVHTLHTRPDIRLLEVQGYADNRGSEDYNQALSTRRAERVREWLIEHGVEPERLQVAARGKSAPIEAGSSEAAHEQNRRVIFRVLEVAEP
jgi:peptidoglycan-associated lipoprotein